MLWLSFRRQCITQGPAPLRATTFSIDASQSYKFKITNELTDSSAIQNSSVESDFESLTRLSRTDKLSRQRVSGDTRLDSGDTGVMRQLSARQDCFERRDSSS
jgi:hypothetical protein